MRLQKYLASCGVASRRSAEKMITDGRVSVNGMIVTELGTQVDETADVVLVDGTAVTPESDKHYIAYNKPAGEVTTASDPEGRDTVMDRFRDYPVRLFPRSQTQPPSLFCQTFQELFLADPVYS